MRMIVPCAIATLILIGAPHAARSQQANAATPQFEVASIKQVIRQNEPERFNRSKGDTSFVGQGGNPFRVSGRRVDIQGTAVQLITAAYDLQPYQIEGAPQWADSTIYAVTAEVGGDSGVTVSQIRQMMQSLLSDRFQLRLHRQTRQVNVYYLTTAPGKIGLKHADDSETFSWKLIPGQGNTLRSKATHEPIADFVRLVGVSADRPVLNRTGMTGYIDYDIVITLNPEDTRNPDAVNRAILDAVKDQLGVKLQAAKDAVEFVEVDQIDRPSEN